MPSMSEYSKTNTHTHAHTHTQTQTHRSRARDTLIETERDIEKTMVCDERETDRAHQEGTMVNLFMFITYAYSNSEYD